MKNRITAFLCIIAAMVSLIIMPSCKESNGFSIDIMNVGDADCILISSDGHHALIDAGEKSDYETIKKTMKSRGVEKLDLFVITHYDNDHIGSAFSVLYDYEVKETIGPDYVRDSSSFSDLTRALRYRDTELKKLAGGQDDFVWQIGSATLTVNVPSKRQYADENDYSLIVTVSYEGRNFLFTGDAIKERMSEFLPQAKSEYFLVKLPHHGDYFASLGELFKNSKVSYAVVSVGTPDRVDSKTKYLINGKAPKGVYTYDGTVSIEYENGSFSIWQ